MTLPGIKGADLGQNDISRTLQHSWLDPLCTVCSDVSANDLQLSEVTVNSVTQWASRRDDRKGSKLDTSFFSVFQIGVGTDLAGGSLNQAGHKNRQDNKSDPSGPAPTKVTDLPGVSRALALSSAGTVFTVVKPTNNERLVCA
ncbi:hypothetical protein Bbelb_354100 [Branchiostoma belcheri]|nr:hypothetical protein Bbelb_354100 [Branchiostoma belcheri]